MKQLPFELVSAVQDLYDLYMRLGPRGPYRLSLFSDPAQVDESWPSPVKRDAPRFDELARGVSCLLANDLPDAATPVIAELWRGIRSLARELAESDWRQPAYFAFITHELARPALVNTSEAYRLFGEILAVYLELICELRPAQGLDYGARIRQLRRTLFQTGEKSSGSEAGGASPSAGES